MNRSKDEQIWWPSTAFVMLNAAIAILFSFLRAWRYVSEDFLSGFNAYAGFWLWFACFFAGSFVCLRGLLSRRNAILASAMSAVVFTFALWFVIVNYQESMGNALRSVVIPLLSGGITTP